MIDSSSTLLFSAIGIFLAQGTIMAVDEFYFHWRRGLKAWEVWGHPVDTLFFLACFFLAWKFPPHTVMRNVWIVLALVSTLIITKDEWVHKKECCAAEQWLHALLFILHPISLWMCYQLWQSGLPEHKGLLLLQTTLIGGFLAYQVFFWQAVAPKLPKFNQPIQTNPLRIEIPS